MERLLRTPMQPREFSEADKKRINEFKDLLYHNGAEFLRETLLRIYFEHTQLLTRVTKDGNISCYDNTSGDLFYFMCVIGLFAPPCE